MTKRRGVIHELFEKHIKHTKEKEIVPLETVYICRLTYSVLNVLGFGDSKVHVSTKVLKHLYDKKPAEEFDFLINSLPAIIKYPDRVYKNKISKRGDFCLVKRLKGFSYLCSVEFCEDAGEMRVCVVTAFRVRDEAYLKKYELLWSWKGGDPSS
jgi:hypothetical protein